MGGDNTTSSTSSTTTSIGGPFEDYIGNILKRAHDASLKVPDTPFKGDFIAPPDPLQLSSLESQQAFYEGLPADFGAGLLDFAQKQASGDLLYAESNPYLQSAIDAAVRPVQEIALESLFPAASSAAIEQGAFGGTREGLVKARLARDLERNIGDIGARMSLDNYNRERALMLAAPNFLEESTGAALIPQQGLYDVGAGFREFEQDELENELRKFQERILAPFRPLLPFTNIVSSLLPAAPTTVTSVGEQEGPEGPPVWLQILQGILGAGSTGASIYGALA